MDRNLLFIVMTIRLCMKQGRFLFKVIQESRKAGKKTPVLVSFSTVKGR